MSKYYIRANGDNLSAFKSTILSGLSAAKEQKTEICLVIPTFEQINSPVSRSFFSHDQINQLSKEKILYMDGVKINLVSTRKLDSYTAHGVVVVLWAQEKMLKKLSQCENYQQLIVLFWNLCVDEDWIDKNKAAEISGGI